MNPDTLLDHKIRPFKRSLAEITIHTLLLLMPIALVLFTVHISQQRTWAQFMQTLVEIGEFLHGEVGWIVSLDVAIMFALFTISVGGQVLGEAMKASKMRGDLGTIAEFVAATSVVVTVMMLPYYWEEPTRFLALFGVIPAVVVLIFLAAQLGSWVFVNTEGQVRETERLQAINQELLADLGRWSSKPWPLVISANLLAIATVSALAFVIRNAHDSLLLMVASDLVAVSLMFVGILLFYFLRFTFKDHIKLGFSWIFLVVLSVVPLIFLFTQVAVTYQGWSPLRDLPGVFIIVAGVVATGFLPGKTRSKFWMDWSIQGVARQFAHRALVRQQDAVQAQWTHLKDKLQSSTKVD